MIIMVSSLANAINECRHIKPEEIVTDTIKSLEMPITVAEKRTYEINILNDDNNIVYRHYCERTTEEKARETAKNACSFYQDLDKCNYTFKVIKIK